EFLTPARCRLTLGGPRRRVSCGAGGDCGRLARSWKPLESDFLGDVAVCVYAILADEQDVRSYAHERVRHLAGADDAAWITADERDDGRVGRRIVADDGHVLCRVRVREVARRHLLEVAPAERLKLIERERIVRRWLDL